MYRKLIFTTVFYQLLKYDSSLFFFLQIMNIFTSNKSSLAFFLELITKKPKGNQILAILQQLNLIYALLIY